MDCSPPSSSIHGIFQARVLEWVAISFSNAWKWKVKVKSLSCVWLFATPWTAVRQAPLSMGVPRQEDWSGLPLPSPRKDLGHPKWDELICSCFRFYRLETQLGWLSLEKFERASPTPKLVGPQHNPDQNTNSIFHRTTTNNSRRCM